MLPAPLSIKIYSHRQISSAQHRKTLPASCYLGVFVFLYSITTKIYEPSLRDFSALILPSDALRRAECYQIIYIDSVFS